MFASIGHWRMSEAVTLAAAALDAAIGWPSALYRRIGHPVGLFARVIDGCERQWNSPARSEAFRRVAGVATVLILLLITLGTGLALEQLAYALFGPMGWVAVAVLAAPALAQRSLYDHVAAVERALRSGDLEQARAAVGMIVGRDTASLDEAGVTRAAIESLAESFCDGVAAPFFWLLILGLPGVWAYKAINTADSMIGHKESRWRAFGWAAARTDDLLNLVPARLAGGLISLASLEGWRVMMRDAGKHASPNAGWPEAAMAGALGLRLAGPIAYDSVTHEKPWIGDGRADADTADIRRALKRYVIACLCLWAIAGAIAWVR